MLRRQSAKTEARQPPGATFVRELGETCRSEASALAAGEVKSRFLHGLEVRERHAVVAQASCREFSDTAVVAHQGDTADHLYMLIKGAARYFFITPGGKQVYLLWLAAGEIFGIASLLSTPAQFLVSAEVVKGSQVLVWRRDVIRNLAERYPRLLENCLSVTDDYLTWHLATHLSLISHTARQRLAHVLFTLASGIGQKCASGVRLDVTNEQLANTANMTLYTATRLLSEWKRAGVVAKTRGQVVLLHPERLFERPPRSFQKTG